MGISIWHLSIVLLVVLLVFGTKKLANVGKDLGAAVKGFKDGIADANAPAARLEADKPESDPANAAKQEASKQDSRT